MSTLPKAPSIPLSQVEWRVQGKPFNGRALYVPFIDSRDCASLLDDWVGPENWSDKYEEGTLNQQPMLWCYLSVRPDRDGEWVTKVDVGTVGNTEPQKSLVSDAFKRVAIIKWGVGRNVYDLPKDMWASVDVKKGGDGKERVYKSKNADAEILAELRKRGIPDPAVKPATDDPQEGPEDPPKTRQSRGPNAEGSADESLSGSNPSASPPDSPPADLDATPIGADLLKAFNDAIESKEVARPKVMSRLNSVTKEMGFPFPENPNEIESWPASAAERVAHELGISLDRESSSEEPTEGKASSAPDPSAPGPDSQGALVGSEEGW